MQGARGALFSRNSALAPVFKKYVVVGAVIKKLYRAQATKTNDNATLYLFLVNPVFLIQPSSHHLHDPLHRDIIFQYP